MKTCRVVLVCCLLALAAVGCQSGYLALNSTDDLKGVYASLPELSVHSILLLHLFANQVNLDNNNKIRPVQSFNPREDFGSHYYGNYEKLIDDVPRGCSFFTLGNIYSNQCSGSKKCPSYFKKPIGNNLMENKGRLLICLDNNNCILKVYLTQHLPYDTKSSAYDKKLTFEISPQLLGELQQFSLDMDLKELKKLRDRYDQNINNNQLNKIANQWTRRQAALGLLIKLLIFFSNRRSKRSYGSEPTPEWRMCELQDINVKATTADGGYITIRWETVPQDLIEEGVAVVIFHNDKDQSPYITLPLTTSEGSYQTWDGMDEGLQARLHRYEDGYFWSSMLDEICRGPEFQNPDPVPVTNYVQLQLFVRNGYSCFRLYIEDCDDRKTNLAQAWVGLYASRWDDNYSYMANQWQYVTKFGKGSGSGDAETYEYCTSTVVVPGLQARFMVQGYDRKASTETWPQMIVSDTNHHVRGEDFVQPIMFQ